MPSSTCPDRHTRRRRVLKDAPRLTGDKLTQAQVSLIESKIQEVDGHWLWLGSVDNDGYPQVCWLTRRYRLHRLWFEHITGAALPLDQEVDHVCTNRRCLLHLEAVSKSENLRRRFARDTRPLFDWRAHRDYRLAVAHLVSIEAES